MEEENFQARQEREEKAIVHTARDKTEGMAALGRMTGKHGEEDRRAGGLDLEMFWNEKGEGRFALLGT